MIRSSPKLMFDINVAAYWMPAFAGMTLNNKARSLLMSLKLFELVGTDASRPFSPYCWRTRMALAHKGLTAESLPWRFTEKSTIAPHGSEKVPVLLHHDKPVVDSWAIANYLEDNFPDQPSLFGGEGGRAMARMINAG